MEPNEYLRALRRRWWVLALAAAAAVVATLLVTPSDAERNRASRRFAAAHTIALVPSINSQKVVRSTVLTGAVRLFNSPELARRVAAEVEFEGHPEELATRIGITADKKRGTITFATLAPTKREVVKVADVTARVAMELQREVNEETYERDLGRINDRVDTLKERLNELDAAAQTGSATARATREALGLQLTTAVGQQLDLEGEGPADDQFATITEATAVRASSASGESFGPPESRRGRLVLALVLALGLAAAVVVVLDRYDTRLSDKDTAEHAFGLPVLTEVPWHSGRGRGRLAVETAVQPLSPAAESYRRLRSSILLPSSVRPIDPDVVAPHPVPAAMGDFADEERRGRSREIKVILVTSPGPREGRTTTVANLAASLAEADRSVLVIDCDLRHPALDQMLEVGPGLGLTDVLMDRGRSYRLNDVARATPVPGVRLVPNGTPPLNPAGLMTEAREVLVRCRAAADVVIVDSAAALVYNDAAELAPAADAVVVVASAGRTSVADARRMTELLTRLGAPIAGVVLVARPAGWLARLAGRGPRFGGSRPSGPPPPSEPDEGRRPGPYESPPDPVPAHSGASLALARPRGRLRGLWSFLRA